MKRKIVLLAVFLTICLNLKAYELDLDLRQYAILTAEQNNMRILISDDINVSSFMFILPKSTKKVMLPTFKKMLDLKGLALFKQKDFYFIDKKHTFDNSKVYYHELNNLVYKDAKKVLKFFDVNSTYIKNTNSITYKTKPIFHDQIKQLLEKLDYQLKQVQFKLTILETSVNKMKEKGLNLSAYLQTVNQTNNEDDGPNKINMNYFVNLITMPYTASSNVLSNSKSGFYAVLKYLESNGITKIKNSPVLTAKSQKPVFFSSVETIPYLVTSTKTKETTTQTQTTYDYRDIGLKIKINPFIIGDKVDFDLDLTIEDILSDKSLTPKTSKKHLVSNYTLKKGDILVLSGINKETTVNNNFGIPILKDIILLKEIFSYKSKEIKNSIFTITIEVL